MDPAKPQVVIMQAPAAPAPVAQPVQPTKGVNSRTLKMILPLVLFGLMVIFNIVFLAGVAASQARCADLDNPWLVYPVHVMSMPKDDPQNPAFTGAFADHQVILAVPNAPPDAPPAIKTVSISEQCRNEYSFPWWLVFFQLMLLGVAIFRAIRPEALARFNTAILILFGMLTALLMSVSSEFNRHVWVISMMIDYMNSDRFRSDPQFAVKSAKLNDIRGTAKDFQNATRAALAGAIVLILLDLIYIALASDSELTPTITLPNTKNTKKQNTTQKTSSSRKAAARPKVDLSVLRSTTPSLHYPATAPSPASAGPLSQDLPPVMISHPNGSYTTGMQQGQMTPPYPPGMQQAYVISHQGSPPSGPPSGSPQIMIPQQLYHNPSPQGTPPQSTILNGVPQVMIPQQAYTPSPQGTPHGTPQQMHSVVLQQGVNGMQQPTYILVPQGAAYNGVQQNGMQQAQPNA